MIERRDYYVYVVFRPNGEPCYVGKGRRTRWKHHQWGQSHNRHLKAIYEKANGELPIWKAQEGLTNEQALDTERALIAALGRADRKAGPLVNLTDGGDGMEGYKQTPEAIAKTVAYHLGRKRSPETCARIGASRVGEKQSAEAIAKRVAKNKGQKRSGEALENLRRAQALNADARRGVSQPATPAMLAIAEKRRGVPLSEETRRKLSKANSGKKRTPEMSARQSERQKGYIATPETRAKIAAAGRGLKRSPETCAKISAYQRTKTFSEETRAKMSASAILRRAREKAEKHADR
jgi:hypothetical protein